MKTFQRIAIADRSQLAHNIYRVLLKPLNFSLFFFRTLRDLREGMEENLSCQVMLINSNTFGKYFESHLGWMQSDPEIQKRCKIFLCEKEEHATKQALQKLKNSFFVEKPFSPSALQGILKKVYDGKAIKP